MWENLSARRSMVLFCGIRLMETVVENANNADAIMPNMNHESANEKLKQGIGSDAGLYSVLLGILVIIFCILGGVWGYGMFGGSIGGICLGLIAGQKEEKDNTFK